MKRSVSRRRFLAGSASFGAGALILPTVVAGAYRANASVGVAVVGVSGRGTWFVGLLERDPAMRGVALCDVDNRRAAKAYAGFPDLPKYEDFRVMLDKQKDIDGVIVATPEFSRALIMAASIKAGKHVFGEKPLTREPYESRVMRQLARKHNVATQMGNQGSSRTTFQQAKALVQAGLLGDVTEVHVWNGGREPKGDGPRMGGMDRTPPTQSQPVPAHLNWDLWLAGAAQRDYHEQWYGRGDETWRGNWKRWRDFFTSGLGWAAPHSAALPFMACRIGELWDADDVSKEDRSIRIVPTVPAVCTVGFPAWESVRYDVPARGGLAPLCFTWHRGVSHFIERSLAEYPQWKDKRPKPWWGHGGSAFVGRKGTLDATHYGDTWNVYPAELADADLLKEIRGDGHERQWLRAIRGECETVSNFAVSGPLNEFLMLGNVATLVGQPFTYDPVTGTVLDHEVAQAALHREYRKGWSL
jgi:hypothetical protein